MKLDFIISVLCMPEVLMSLPTKLNLLAALYNCNGCGGLFIGYFLQKALFLPLKKNKKKDKFEFYRTVLFALF